MEKKSRRDAIRDYKERKVSQGIYAIRCAPTGEVWIGMSRNLEQQQNGFWFSLRNGGHPNKPLQAAWKTHGAEAFTFEVVEVFEGVDASDYERANWLKARDAHWRETLGARKAVG